MTHPTLHPAGVAGGLGPDEAGRLADLLATARRERRAIPQLSDDHPGLTVPDGYAVQRVAREAAGPLLGWKLGVTSRAKQVQVGVDAPIYGFLAGEHPLDVGELLAVDQYIQPRGEPEIVLVLGRDLDGPRVTAADVLAAAAAVAVGIEVLDSRFQDYRFTIPDVVADNASASRYVVGTPVPVAGIDLRLVGVVLEHNGDVVATASGAASLGHPAAAVAWMVRELAASGEGIRAGQLVLTGGLTAAVPLRAGDCLVATVDRIGSLELGCE
jgi:2-keto-4-pentenoate hydratase